MDAVIVASGRPDEAGRCVESIARLTRAGVIVVVNGPCGETLARLKALKERYPRIVIHHENERVPKSRARNTAVSLSRADLLFFIDDDAFVDFDICALAAEKHERYPGTAAVGGPNLTPPGSSRFQRLAGYVLASPFTAWRMRSRFCPVQREGECTDAALTLCNLFVKRAVLVKEGLAFDERLHYNEENLLLRQLAEKGYRAVYAPEMVVLHERRPDAAGFARQVFDSGKGRAKMTRMLPRSFSPVYAMPALFCLYLILAAIAPAAPVLAPLAVYLAVDAVNAAAVAARNGESMLSVPALFVLSPVAHIAYGLGFLAGLAQPLGKST